MKKYNIRSKEIKVYDICSKEIKLMLLIQQRIPKLLLIYFIKISLEYLEIHCYYKYIKFL